MNEEIDEEIINFKKSYEISIKMKSIIFVTRGHQTKYFTLAVFHLKNEIYKRLRFEK